MLSVPYSIEVNDVTLFGGRSLTGPDFRQIVIDQFDQLYADSMTSGRVMALCLPPFIINQSFRHKYLEQALEYIARHPGCLALDQRRDRRLLLERDRGQRIGELVTTDSTDQHAALRAEFRS
jgi:hypothetical protein